MKYSLFILRQARKELASLEETDYQKIKEVILRLAEEPRPFGCSKLVGREGWRIKVGSFRVIYEINDQTKEVIILHVGHRRDVYR